MENTEPSAHPADSDVGENDEQYKFDPSFAGNLLLELAEERELDPLLQKLIDRIAARPGVARVRIWLMDKGDLCATCRLRDDCPEKIRCLHSVASGGNFKATPEEHRQRIRDEYARIPLGYGVVGKVAASGQQVVLRHLDKDPGELLRLDWLKQEGIRTFNGVPIVYKGEVLGVIAVFSRVNPPEEALRWGRIFAHHIAGALINARAFGEIERLKGLMEMQNEYLQEEVVEAKAFGDLVGQSAALRRIISQIDLVAPTDASALLLGETGTGKELVAHEIHRRSRRSAGPMIRVNCASIPRELFESEFFGHARGAFTGAIKDRAGRFETAEGGTLFLDEIGEVPLELQGKLLRALQEKRYERVGEDRARVADVRVVAATNRDLKSEVAAGRFREDLYYRLNVFPIQVMPLRERKEDIPLLAQHFVDLTVKELRCPEPRLTRAGMARLQDYDWPGNIRELRNVIERAVIIARGGAMEFDLPAGGKAAAGAAASSPASNAAQPAFLTEAELRRRERNNILAVLNKAGWKIKGPNGAAELLGVKPTTLLSRVKKMGLQRTK